MIKTLSKYEIKKFPFCLERVNVGDTIHLPNFDPFQFMASMYRYWRGVIYRHSQRIGSNFPVYYTVKNKSGFFIAFNPVQKQEEFTAVWFEEECSYDNYDEVQSIIAGVHVVKEQ